MLHIKCILILVTLMFNNQIDAQQKLFKQEIQINNHHFIVEIADTHITRALGLMHRHYLEKNHGMLFVFSEEAPRSFYMKNTLIPLSIAYINQEGIILEIYDMQPHSLESITSQYPAMYALELNQGVFAQLNIKPGAKILNLPNSKLAD